jgi:membrane fusion protein (multidrug efflux system)
MSKRTILIPLAILAVAAFLFFAIHGNWTSWEGGRGAQKTDDAYVRADMVPLSTRISGTVRKVAVEDFQPVKAGQPLVELDDEDYRATVEQAKAGLAAAQAALEDNQAAKRIQEAKIQNAETGVAQAEASVSAAQAGIASVQPEVERAALERKRQEALIASKATTHQTLEGAIADSDQFSGVLASREADLKRAQASLNSSHALLNAEKLQLAALDTRDAGYRADIQARQAAIVVAEVNLGYTRINAPNDGAVSERHVQDGQLVAPGMQVIDLVKGDVWIQANYKETQLTNIRKGDVADIRIDTFPGVVLQGKVEEVAPASGSQFALLPPDNATGNFTKVVQRIPVKIVLDADHPLQGKLRPGFSAEVTIHASGKNAKTEGNEP